MHTDRPIRMNTRLLGRYTAYQALWPAGAITISLIGLLIFVSALWRYSWDDSAITLAFARNLARYGDIIASQYGDRVEGSSSALWMLIHALWFTLGLSQDNVLTAAKLLSTALVIVNMLLYAQLAQRLLSSRFTRTIAVCGYMLCSTTIFAAVDGMETALYATLVLSMALIAEQRPTRRLHSIAFTVLGALLVVIRHEGILFLIPFAIAAFRVNWRAALRDPHWYLWVGAALCYHGWHYWYFGDLLTNPMHAKHYWPYGLSTPSLLERVQYHLYPLLEAGFMHLPLIVFIAIIAIPGKIVEAAQRVQSQQSDRAVYLAATGLAIYILIGDNFSAAHRLAYPALPFLIIILLRMIDGVINTRQPIRQWMALVFAAVFIVSNLSSVYNRRIQSSVNVDTVKQIGQTVTHIQSLLGKARLTYLGPDMGGLLLYYGDGKRVLDLGLLCDPILAHNGYAALDAYVRAEQPDIIETHTRWTYPVQETRIVFEQYTPMRLSTRPDMIFLVRNDLIANIAHRAEINYVPIGNATQAAEIDERFMSRFTTMIVVEDTIANTTSDL
jgi:hypothetical protein